MEILPRIIQQMAKEEARYFQLFATRFDYGEERMDTRLFELIRKMGKDYADEPAALALYGSKHNTFARTKSRLWGMVNKSLLIHHIDEDPKLLVFKWYLLYTHFLGRRDLEAALYYLRRSERDALKMEHYEMLDLIYSAFVHLGSEDTGLHPETYIRKRKENLMNLHRLRQMDEVLALAAYQLRTAHNFADEQAVLKVLQKLTKEVSAQRAIRNSKLFQHKLFRIISQILIRQHAYAPLEVYLTKTLKDLKQRHFFDRQNHDMKLQMLNYLVNALYRTKQYSKALSILQEQYAAMHEFQKLLFSKYEIFYYNALGLVHFRSGHYAEAVAIYTQLKDKILPARSLFEVSVYFNLAEIYFEQKDFDTAIQYLIELSVLDGFKKADKALKLKIALAELVIRFELRDPDVFEYRMSQVKRQFRALLNSPVFQREQQFLRLLQQMFYTPSLKANKTILKRIEQFIRDTPKDLPEDSDVLPINRWLGEKHGRMKK